MKIFHFHLLLCPNHPPCRLKRNHFMKFLFLLCNYFILFPYRLSIDTDEQKNTVFSFFLLFNSTRNRKNLSNHIFTWAMPSFITITINYYYYNDNRPPTTTI